MFFSDEPGFYKDGEFGIRIESVLRVVNLPFKDETYGKFVGFEPVTLVPFEPKLIDFSMMSPGQESIMILADDKLYNNSISLSDILVQRLQRQNSGGDLAAL